MPKIDQAVFSDWKYALIAITSLCATSWLLSLGKRLIAGPRTKAPHRIYRKVLLVLVIVFFSALTINLGFVAIGAFRLRAAMLAIKAEGNQMPGDYPADTFYFGYQDVADRFAKLIGLLQAKCKAVESLKLASSDAASARPYNSKLTEGPPGKYFVDDGSTNPSPAQGRLADPRRTELQVYRLKNLILSALDDCSDQEKRYLQRAQEISEQVSFRQTRFNHCLEFLANKAWIVSVGLTAIVLIIGGLCVYAGFWFRREYNRMDSDDYKVFGRSVIRSLGIILLTTTILSAMSVALVYVVPLVNATSDIKNVYESKQETRDRTLVTDEQLIRHRWSQTARKIRAVVLARVTGKANGGRSTEGLNESSERGDLSVREIDPKRAAADIDEVSDNTASPELLGILNGVRKLLDLQDSIDDEAQETTDGIVKSTWWPLMRRQLEYLDSVQTNGLYWPVCLGLFLCLANLLVHSAQIMGAV